MVKKDISIFGGGWNYRVFRYKTKWKDERGRKHISVSYGIHEAYYSKDGKEVNGWTKDAIIAGDSIEDLFKVLKRIENDIKRFPEILDYDKES